MRHTLLSLLIGLSACTTLVPGTIARLYALSPLEADPADIAVALRLPDGVAVQPNSAQIVLTAERQDTGETSAATYTLSAIKTSEGNSIYRIADEDHDQLRTQQELIAGWKAEDADASKGSLSVQLAGCKTAQEVDPNPTLDISIRTSQDDAFMPLVRGAKLTQVFKVAGIESLPPCV